MIKCPYCGKQFEVQAIDSSTGLAQPNQKWYFSTYWLVIGLLCIGPIALPLMWFNPRYKPITKWIVSVVVIILTIWISMKSIEMYKTLRQQLGNMGGNF